MEEFHLEAGEHVVTTVRQHVFVLALKLLPFVVLFFAPAILHVLFAIFTAATPDASLAITGFDIPDRFVRFIKGVFYLGLWIGAFTTFTRYYLTVWIITNLRIVDIKQWGFWNREVSSFLLIRVQDVTTEITGVFGTLIGFGRLHVETAGSSDHFTMSGISRPTHVRDLIMSQVAQFHHGEGDVTSPAAGV